MDRDLEVYVDESGELSIASSDDNILFVLSLIIVNKDLFTILDYDEIASQLAQLKVGGMIHTAPLVRMEENFKGRGLGERRDIFWTLRQARVKPGIDSISLLIDRTKLANKYEARDLLRTSLGNTVLCHPLLVSNRATFYYDCGQRAVADILFEVIDNTEHEIVTDFDHITSLPFQLADLVTYTERLAFKQKIGLPLNRSEKLFFTKNELRMLLKQANGIELNQ